MHVTVPRQAEPLQFARGGLMISAVLVANYNYNRCQEQNEQILLPAFLERERERKSLDSCPRMSNF